MTDEIMASHGQRIGNRLIDLTFEIILMFCILGGLVLVSLLLDWNGFIYWMQHVGMFQQYLLGAVISILYNGLSETIMEGRTIGKFITGTVVVNQDGTVPDANVILKRTFCRLIPLEWITFLGTPPRGWHDSIPDVYVVDKKLFDARVKSLKQNNMSTPIQ